MAKKSDDIHRLKVVLVGDSSVGKTAIVARFANNSFGETYRTTIGLSHVAKHAVVDDDVINYQIWDTAGQERFQSLVPMYLRGAHIALVVYDVTSWDSFNHVENWLERLRMYSETPQTVIVGNKCDLDKVVDDETALNLAQHHGIQFVYVSAKTGYNVETLFHRLGSKAVHNLKRKAEQALSNGELQKDMYFTNISLSINLSDKHDKSKIPKWKRMCCA